jgi:hypothetical protein
MQNYQMLQRMQICSASSVSYKAVGTDKG